MRGQIFLYVAEFDCGTVKVGATRNPAWRRRTVRADAPVPVGPMRKWHLFEPESGWSELSAVRAIGAITPPLTGKIRRSREWFGGITFDAAVSICAAFASLEREKRADRENRTMRRKPRNGGAK